MYEKCLQLAGAKVTAFEKFGSYQGNWWAKVKYKGKTGWITRAFGSCSVCDAFEAEFGKGLLEDIISQEEAEKKASENLFWDMGARKMLDFIRKNAT